MQDYDAKDPHVDGNGVGENKEDGHDVLNWFSPGGIKRQGRRS